ncbi:MAG: hypothetical protein MRECE_2c073 [Mycoplasmataceae bacterium CE_OT135]|nr:MAG: hypothetical protein MRECE_2c073 [Mycoplasmataceae bacterium CE_OT135]
MKDLEQLNSLKQAIHQPGISLTRTSDLYLAAQHLFHALPSVENEYLLIFLDIFIKATEIFNEYSEKWLIQKTVNPTFEELTLMENFAREISHNSEQLLKSEVFTKDFAQTNQDLQAKVKFLLATVAKEKIQRQPIPPTKNQTPWWLIFPLSGVIGLLAILALYWLKKPKKAQSK